MLMEHTCLAFWLSTHITNALGTPYLCTRLVAYRVPHNSHLDFPDSVNHRSKHFTWTLPTVPRQEHADIKRPSSGDSDSPPWQMRHMSSNEWLLVLSTSSKVFITLVTFSGLHSSTSESQLIAAVPVVLLVLSIALLFGCSIIGIRRLGLLTLMRCWRGYLSLLTGALSLGNCLSSLFFCVSIAVATVFDRLAIKGLHSSVEFSGVMRVLELAYTALSIVTIDCFFTVLTDILLSHSATTSKVWLLELFAYALLFGLGDFVATMFVATTFSSESGSEWLKGKIPWKLK